MPISQRFFGLASTALLAAGFVIVLIIAGASLWLVGRSGDETGWVNHTLQVQQHVADISALVERMESGRRGYLLTGNPGYIEVAETSGRSLQAALAEFAALTTDNPEQQEHYRQLSALIGARMGEVARAIESGRADLAAARAAFANPSATTSLAPARQLIGVMMQAEANLLAERSGAARRTAAALSIVSIAGAVGIVLLAIGSTWLVRTFMREIQASREQLRTINEGLERTVQERTADLTHANEEIQRFAYIVSHDLRAPLVNIMGFTSELETGLGDIRRYLSPEAGGEDTVPAAIRTVIEADWPEALGFIRTSTEKMDRLINAILKLSREGRRSFTPERLDTTVLMGNIADGVRHQAEELGAEIRVEPLPAVVTDRLAFEQIFGNLVDNAIKYLKRGLPGVVTIRARDFGRMVEFEVEDNGRGIDPKDHERIFDLFRRSGAQDRPGEGIGLAHVRTLVRRLGGTIGCSSELGRGTTFRVTIPKYLTNEKGLAA